MELTREIIEVRKLVEAGFEYVCTMNGIKLFRKRKWTRLFIDDTEQKLTARVIAEI